MPPFMQKVIVLLISESPVRSTLYVGLAHAAPFTQYIAFTAFSTNWLPEGSTLRYTCKEEQISSLG